MTRAIPLVCPDCKLELTALPDALACESCQARYPVREGIPVFTRGEDFYETYAEEHIPYVTNPPAWKGAILRFLPYYSWREWKFFRSQVQPGEAILDLGSGRGKEWFSAGASYTAGIDPCWSVLPDCARHYDQAAQAEVARLPFPDASFDAVFSAHVFGHIPVAEKDAALAEVARVLKPGGRFVNLIETDSMHAFARYGKQDPELYHRNFVETDGHVGLEYPSMVLNRLQDRGFKVNAIRKMESGVVHLRFYEKYLGKGYPERDQRIGRHINLWRRIQANPLLLQMYEVGMGMYYELVEQRTTPLDDAMFLCVSATKA